MISSHTIGKQNSNSQFHVNFRFKTRSCSYFAVHLRINSCFVGDHLGALLTTTRIMSIPLSSSLKRTRNVFHTILLFTLLYHVLAHQKRLSSVLN